MATPRQVVESVLSGKVKVVVVDVPQEFIHLDKMKQGWRLTISKNLMEGDNGITG